MAVHVPLNVHRAAAAVLVVGGGDGGVVSELAQHRGIERITLVEPFTEVLDATRRWFPSLAQAFTDPRVSVVHQDAAEYVRDTRERYDLIIVDDCGGTPAMEGGGAQAFYCDSYRILAGDGILVNRAGSADYPARRRDLVARAGKIKRLFPIFRLYRATPPAGEPGETLLGFASKRYDPLADFDAAGWESRGIETRFYTPAMHRAAFALPRHVEELFAGV
jgi:spermidine synthase